MKSSILIIAASLFGSALASPSQISDSISRSVDTSARTILPKESHQGLLLPPFEILILTIPAAVIDLSPDAECSLLKCASVVGSAVCIAEAIALKKPTKLLQCVKKDKVRMVPDIVLALAVPTMAFMRAKTLRYVDAWVVLRFWETSSINTTFADPVRSRTLNLSPRSPKNLRNLRSLRRKRRRNSNYPNSVLSSHNM